MFLRNLLVLACCYSMLDFHDAKAAGQIVNGQKSDKKVATNETKKVLSGKAKYKNVKISKKEKSVEKAKIVEMNLKGQKNHYSTSAKRDFLLYAFESALKNNKEISSDKQDIKAKEQEMQMRMSAFRPQVAAHAGYTYGERRSWKSPKHGATNKSDIDDKTAGLTVKQNVFNGGSSIASVKECRMTLAAQNSEHRAKIQKIFNDIAVLCGEIATKKKEIEHLNVLFDARNSCVSVAKERHAAGDVKYLEVSQANAASDETQSRIQKTEAEYVELCAKFEEATGIPVPENIDIPTTQFLNFDEKTVEQAMKLALQDNPSILAAVDRCAAAKAAVGTVNAKFSPSVDLQAGCEYDLDKKFGAQKGQDDSKTNCTVGVVLSVPLYEGGAGLAARRQYQDIAVKAAIDKDRTIAGVKTSIVSIWAANSAAKRRIESSKKAVKHCVLALQDTQEEYRAGLKIIKDVLDAQQQLFEARFSLIQAEKVYFISQCNGAAVLGKLLPLSLRTPKVAPVEKKVAVVVKPSSVEKQKADVAKNSKKTNAAKVAKTTLPATKKTEVAKKAETKSAAFGKKKAVVKEQGAVVRQKS